MIALASIQRVRQHVNRYVEIAGRSAVGTGSAFSGKANFKSVIYTRLELYPDLFVMYFKYFGGTMKGLFERNRHFAAEILSAKTCSALSFLSSWTEERFK